MSRPSRSWTRKSGSSAACTDARVFYEFNRPSAVNLEVCGVDRSAGFGSRLGHLLRVRSLLQLCLPAPGHFKLIALVAAASTLIDWVLLRSAAEAFGLAGLAMTALLAVGVRPASDSQRKGEPLLKCEGFRNQPWNGMTVQPVGIQNIQEVVEPTANNVRARIAYQHAPGARFDVEPAAWMAPEGGPDPKGPIDYDLSSNIRWCAASPCCGRF